MSDSSAASSSRDCPKFNTCSAPICPLDTSWQSRRYLSEDPVCQWMREAVKPDGEALLHSVLPSEVAKQVLWATPKIASSMRSIGKRLERSATSGSRVRNAIRLQSTR